MSAFKFLPIPLKSYGSPFQRLRLSFQDLLREAGSASNFLLMKTRPGYLPRGLQDGGGRLLGQANSEEGGFFTPVVLSSYSCSGQGVLSAQVQGLSRGLLTSFQHLASSSLAQPMPSCRKAGAGDRCPRVRAGVRAGEHLPPSSCSADCHSPGKQTSGHSLLSSAFTLAMPKSLLLSHSIPRNARVLWPVRELTQLERGWRYFFSALLSLKKKKKILRMETKKIKSYV